MGKGFAMTIAHAAADRTIRVRVVPGPAAALSLSPHACHGPRNSVNFGW